MTEANSKEKFLPGDKVMLLLRNHLYFLYHYKAAVKLLKYYAALWAVTFHTTDRVGGGCP
jgi:hypothetical protein